MIGFVFSLLALASSPPAVSDTIRAEAESAEAFYDEHGIRPLRDDGVRALAFNTEWVDDPYRVEGDFNDDDTGDVVVIGTRAGALWLVWCLSEPRQFRCEAVSFADEQDVTLAWPRGTYQTRHTVHLRIPSEEEKEFAKDFSVAGRIAFALEFGDATSSGGQVYAVVEGRLVPAFPFSVN